MLGLFLLAWVVAPLLMLAVSLGLGLLVRSIAGGGPSGVFVLPVGFAAALVIGSLFTQWGATAELTPVALVLPAVAGLLIGGRSLRHELRPSAWPAVAALAGFAAVAAPVVLAGEVSFTGYGRIVDLGHHFDFATYLASHGRDSVGVADSSYEALVRKILAAGYPGAWQSLLGAYARLVGTDVMWIYQPLLALTSGMGAMAAYGLLSRAIRQPALRAVAAGVAIQANVLYAYGIVGGFKELAAAFLLLLAAGLAAELGPGLERPRSAVPLGVALAACVAAFSLGILPWLGVILAGFVLITLWRSRARTRVAAGWAAVAAVALVLSIPAIIEASKLASIAARAEGGSSASRTAIIDLGNLAAAMPVRAATGIWPNVDYRFPDKVEGGLTVPLMLLVLALAAAGLVAALRRRDWGLALLGAAGGVGLAYYMARTGPWIQLKAIAITGTVVLACAFAGAVAVGGWLRRLGGSVAIAASWVLVAVVALAVLYGNALAYHDTTLAPTPRLRDLERIADRYSGRGPALYPDFEEFADYLLRKEDGIGIVDPPANRILQRRPGARPRRGAMGFSWDTDQVSLRYLQGFSLLVRRRGPDRSRPPSNWQLVERTKYHEVWRKAKPARTVLVHQPGEERYSCEGFARKARDAGSARIAYVQAPDVTRFPLGRAQHPAIWTNSPDTVAPYGEGKLTGEVAVRRSGSYEFWIQGGFGRAVRFSVDGEPLGTLKRLHSYAGQFYLVARRALGAGRHRIELSRGGGNLEPGDQSGVEVPLGPMLLVRQRPLPVRTAPVRDARAICSRGGLDWIEVVRG